MSEQVFYNENGVTVTSARLVVGVNTYAMSSVFSVNPVTESPSLMGPFVLMGIGFLALLSGFVYKPPGATNADWVFPPASWTSVFVGISIFVAGFAWAASRKPTYHIVLSKASGDEAVLNTKNSEVAADIIHALNKAIAHRG